MKDLKLALSFSELFDFLDITKTFKLLLGENGEIEREVEGEMKKVGFEEVVSLDWVIGKSHPDYEFFSGKQTIITQIGSILIRIKIIAGAKKKKEKQKAMS